MELRLTKYILGVMALVVVGLILRTSMPSAVPEVRRTRQASRGGDVLVKEPNVERTGRLVARDLVWTLSHEVGHHNYASRKLVSAERIEAVFPLPRQTSPSMNCGKANAHFVSAYGRVDPEEDWADTFALWFKSSVRLWVKGVQHLKNEQCDVLLRKIANMGYEYLSEDESQGYIYTSNNLFRLRQHDVRDFFQTVNELCEKGWDADAIEVHMDTIYASHADPRRHDDTSSRGKDQGVMAGNDDH